MFAEAERTSVELCILPTTGLQERLPVVVVSQEQRKFAAEGVAVNKKSDSKVPPPVIRGDPESSLENELSHHPTDLGAKVDLGSDESMDASDPIAATQPGSTDEPVPSSGFPDEAKNSS